MPRPGSQQGSSEGPDCPRAVQGLGRVDQEACPVPCGGWAQGMQVSPSSYPQSAPATRGSSALTLTRRPACAPVVAPDFFQPQAAPLLAILSCGAGALSPSTTSPPLTAPDAKRDGDTLCPLHTDHLPRDRKQNPAFTSAELERSSPSPLPAKPLFPVTGR